MRRLATPQTLGSYSPPSNHSSPNLQTTLPASLRTRWLPSDPSSLHQSATLCSCHQTPSLLVIVCADWKPHISCLDIKTSNHLCSGAYPLHSYTNHLSYTNHQCISHNWPKRPRHTAAHSSALAACIRLSTVLPELHNPRLQSLSPTVLSDGPYITQKNIPS